MNRLEALTALKEAVEAGDNGTLVLPDFTDALSSLPPLYQSKHNGPNAWRALNGSLDAARALHEAVLPGWGVDVFNLGGEIVLRRTRPINTVYGEALRQGCPARAWLLAILAALITQEQGQ